MIGEAGSYVSGNWFVREGSENLFVSRWTEFLEWSREVEQGFRQALLIRDSATPRHFISVVQWENAESQEAWRAQPEWPDRFQTCRELCDRFEGPGTFSLAADVRS